MKLNVGIIGYCCETGLGIVNQEFYKHLPFEKWLVIENSKAGISYGSLDSACSEFDWKSGYNGLIKWLKGLDTLFAVETGYIPNIWRIAKSLGIQTVLMPNAEWFRPSDPEMALIDTFIAPTLDCFEMLKQSAYGSKVFYVPHALDTDRFGFKQRQRAMTFLHCRGWGGYQERKGTMIVFEAAKQCGEVQFLVRYQEPLAVDWPENVQLLGSADTPEELYLMGDVAIQPSRWEGVGLQILESMSSGIPVIVPDGPPMNEYPVDKSLCIDAIPSPVKINGKIWTAWEMDANALAQRIRSLHGTSISELSTKSRLEMEKRSWKQLTANYSEILNLT